MSKRRPKTISEAIDMEIARIYENALNGNGAVLTVPKSYSTDEVIDLVLRFQRLGSVERIGPRKLRVKI